MIYTDNPQRTKAANSPPPERTELQKGEPRKPEPLLEEKSADPPSAEPLVPHQSPPPVTHPTPSGEVFLKENASSVCTSVTAEIYHSK